MGRGATQEGRAWRVRARPCHQSAHQAGEITAEPVRLVVARRTSPASPGKTPATIPPPFAEDR